MEKKLALIATAFFSYDENVRVRHLEEVLSKKGYTVQIISSDFDHRNKIEYKNNKENLSLLHVPAYSRNMSFQRINSHYVFSNELLKKCNEIHPNLIYAITPPNFMNKALKKYKQQNPDTIIITEIEDLWPESMPVSHKIKALGKPAFSIWASIRNKNLKYSDAIVFECELFKNFLQKYTYQKDHLVHLTKADILLNKSIHSKNMNTIHYLYLGSVNNLLDIDKVVEIVKKSNILKPSVLHVIGGGEAMEDLKGAFEKNGLSLIEHGILFDEEKKQEIISQCDFALNIMKDTVFVGVTMKSIDYFCYGMPVINNINGDTVNIINTYCCGFNILDHLDEQIEKICAMNRFDWEKQNSQSRKVYEDLFSYKAVESELTRLFNSLNV